MHLDAAKVERYSASPNECSGSKLWKCPGQATSAESKRQRDTRTKRGKRNEIIQAWIQNRPIDRQKIIKNLRETLASYSRGDYVEIMNENYWLSSVGLVKAPSKDLVKAR